MSEQKHLPTSEEKNEKALQSALIAKVELEKLGIEVPLELQSLLSKLQDESAKKVGEVLKLEDATELKLSPLTPEQKEALLKTLEARFKANEKLHPELLAEGGKKSWENVKVSLEADEEALKSINEMEKAGHEPDVYNFDDMGFDVGTCSKESPEKQRNCNFLESLEMGKAMGVPHMTRKQYRDFLQSKGNFDTDSYSWLDAYKSKEKARLSRYRLALMGDRCYGDATVIETVAREYAKDLGWRGSLRVEWKS